MLNDLRAWQALSLPYPFINLPGSRVISGKRKVAFGSVTREETLEIGCTDKSVVARIGEFPRVKAHLTGNGLGRLRHDLQESNGSFL